MFLSMVQPNITVDVAESTLFQVLGAQSRTVVLVLENLDLANTLTYKVEYSSDNSTWNDFVVTTTLAPSTVSSPIDLVGYPFFRVRGSGNLTIAADVSGHFDWNDTFAVLNI